MPGLGTGTITCTFQVHCFPTERLRLQYDQTPSAALFLRLSLLTSFRESSSTVSVLCERGSKKS